MKNKPHDYARLLHIQDAVLEIQNYLQGVDFESFENDSKTKFASIKQLEIIGEAAYHLSEELKLTYPNIQWRAIITLRHILVHEYYGIQNDILWRILTTHIPEFQQQIQHLLKTMEDQDAASK